MTTKEASILENCHAGDIVVINDRLECKLNDNFTEFTQDLNSHNTYSAQAYVDVNQHSMSGMIVMQKHLDLNSCDAMLYVKSSVDKSWTSAVNAIKVEKKDQ